MRARLFTFRYSATLGGFDDSALLDFARDKELLAFRDHFFVVNDVPHLTCVLTYQDAIVPPEVLQAAREVPRREERAVRSSERRERSARNDRPDVTDGLSEPERVLFNTLRDWRSRKAHDEGVPPYLVFTNRHLLEIVRRRPDSPTALMNLDGIGPGKVKRYAAEVLRVLHGEQEKVDEAAEAIVQPPEEARLLVEEATPVEAAS